MEHTTIQQMPEWILLNNQTVDENGNPKDLSKDKEAVRSYFVDYINNHTKFFHTLREKLDYLLDNEYYEREFIEKYAFKDIKSLFKEAYNKKFRFNSYMAAFKFYNDYALKDRKDPSIFLERYEDRLCIVALYHADGDIELARKLLRSLINQDFTPATPTLLNSGRKKRGEMVSCFLYEIGDSLNDIARANEFALQLSKLGGGVSLNLNNLRARGETIKGTPGVCKGVVGVMKLLDNAFRYADQMGQRPGAGAVYLNVAHPDFEEFLNTRKINADDDIRVKTLSIGAILPNRFIEAVKQDKDFYQFYPYTVYKETGKSFSEICANLDEWYDKLVENPNVRKTKVNARRLLSTIATVQSESGYPYLFFQENVNKGNPFKTMEVKFSNLCLTGDTVVAVADGRNGLRIDELAAYSNGEKKIPVYSSHKTKNKIVGVKNGGKVETGNWSKPEIKDAVAFCSGFKEVYQITLSNGDSFKCTAEHPLGTLEGEYIPAIDSLGVTLQPFFTYSPIYRDTFYDDCNGVKKCKGLTVTSIKKIGVEPVYDLTVEGNHNFYIITSGDESFENCQGVLVHNCTEILQPTICSKYADYHEREKDEVGLGVSCNLSSGNMVNMLEHNTIQETVDSAMTLMTSVSSKTQIKQVPEVAKANELFRSVGFGMMNVAGYFAKNGIIYGSPESIEIVDVFFNIVNYYSLLWSMNKAKKTGSKFYNFENTTYADGTYFDNHGEILPKIPRVQKLFENVYIPTKKDWNTLKKNVMEYGLYNSFRLAVAPTGSVSYVMGATAGVTPIKQLVEERTYGNSKTYFPMPYSDTMSFMYETAYKLDKFKTIDVIAAIQTHIDQGISFELCVESNLTTRDIAKFQMYAEHKGLRTIYYVRTRKLKITECQACAV